MAVSLPVRVCLLAALLVATAAAVADAPLPTAQNRMQRATGDEDAPPTAPTRRATCAAHCAGARFKPYSAWFTGVSTGGTTGVPVRRRELRCG